ncbi:hypothetical protein ACQWF3_25340, partial [Salmonella enterica subsp. enterica serovar Infantis]
MFQELLYLITGPFLVFFNEAAIIFVHSLLDVFRESERFQLGGSFGVHDGSANIFVRSGIHS